MDSTAIAAIEQNTMATMYLTGSLWLIAGFAATIAVGLFVIHNTLHGR